jgi:opacity protein-like surface antigen
MPLFHLGKFIEAYEENHMKRFLGYAAMLALLSAPAFAAKNSDNVTLSQSVTIGNTQLPAADYRVTWTGTGSAVQVTLTHGKSTVTVPAKLVDQKNGVTSVLTATKDGANVLEGINLNKVSLVFSSSPNSGQ